MRTKKQKVRRVYVHLTDPDKMAKRESLTVYGGTPLVVKQVLVKAIERIEKQEKAATT